MAAMDIKICEPTEVTLDISGPKALLSVMSNKAAEVRKKAVDMGGRIIIDKSFDDGFTITVSFADSDKAKAFKVVIGN